MLRIRPTGFDDEVAELNQMVEGLIPGASGAAPGSEDLAALAKRLGVDLSQLEAIAGAM